MASFQPPVFNRSLPAAADLSTKQFFAVVNNGSEKYAVAGANFQIAGFLQNVPLLDEFSEVATIGGGSKAVAGGTITAKDKLETNGSGQLILATGSSKHQIVAVALEDAVVNDVFAVQPVAYEQDIP